MEPGTEILTLDMRDVSSRSTARAQKGAAEANLRLVQAGRASRTSARRESQVAAARAEVSAARAELEAAAQDLERFETLLQNNSGSRKQRDDAATRRDVAKDRVTRAESRVRPADEVLAQMKAGASRKKSMPRAPASRPPTRKSPRCEKAITDATLPRRSPAS